jgi:hypothetical protein
LKEAVTFSTERKQKTMTTIAQTPENKMMDGNTGTSMTNTGTDGTNASMTNTGTDGTGASMTNTGTDGTGAIITAGV